MDLAKDAKRIFDESSRYIIRSSLLGTNIRSHTLVPKHSSYMTTTDPEGRVSIADCLPRKL